MIERLIFRIVRDGLEHYTADTGQRFERFCLTELELEPTEVAKARVYFAGGTDPDGNAVEARPPTWQHGYPRQGGPFPLWALTLGGERDATTYLGDDAFPLDEDGNRYVNRETGEIVDPKILRVEYSYVIMCMADHPDINVIYYHLLKHIIRRERGAFIDAGMEPPTLNGADLAPDPRYLPSDIFVRQLTVQVEADECWTETDTDGRAFRTRGLHVDDTTNEETAGAGSQRALVTPYTDNGS